MKLPDRTEVVAEYVRARLRLECSVRGRAVNIASQTGVTPAHISYVTRGQRGVGIDFATTMARYWGVTYDELERLAFEAHKLPVPTESSGMKDLPNLRDTVEWCINGKVYPPQFLRRYEREAAQPGVDRARREWLIDIEATFQAREAAKGRGRRLPPKVRSKEEPSGIYLKDGVPHHEVSAAAASNRRQRVAR